MKLEVNCCCVKRIKHSVLLENQQLLGGNGTRLFSYNSLVFNSLLSAMIVTLFDFCLLLFIVWLPLVPFCLFFVSYVAVCSTWINMNLAHIFKVLVFRAHSSLSFTFWSMRDEKPSRTRQPSFIIRRIYGTIIPLPIRHIMKQKRQAVGLY